jgi:hypothetical protein
MFENINVEQLREMIIGAYNKYKNRLYYTRGLLLYKKELAEFEFNNFDNKIECLTKFLWKYLNDIETKEDIEYLNKLIVQISYIQEVKRIDETSESINFNFFIDMPIELHIIDTIWTVYAAHPNSKTKQKDEYHYGNLIDTENLYNGNDWNTVEFKDINWKNNSLFKKYVQGYNNWITNVLKKIESNKNIYEHMTLLSIDMRRYYYSTYKSLDYFTKLNSTYGLDKLTSILTIIYNKYYCELEGVTKIKLSEGFLPIGMASSMYLSNIFLEKFDENINQNENVLFYGRYVDDIIILFDTKTNNNNLMKIIKNELSKTNYYQNIILNEEKTRSFLISKSHFLTDFEIINNYLKSVGNKYYGSITNEELSFKKYIDFDKRVLKSNLMEKSQITEEELVAQDIKDILLFMNYIFDQVEFKTKTLDDVYSKILTFVSEGYNVNVFADIFMWLSKFGRRKEDTIKIYETIKEKIDTLSNYKRNEIEESNLNNKIDNFKTTSINNLKCAYLMGTIKNELKINNELNEKFEKSNLKKKYGLIKYLIQIIKEGKKSFKNGESFYNEYFDGYIPFIHLDEIFVYDQIVNILKNKFSNSIKTFVKINKMENNDFKYLRKSKKLINTSYDSYEYNIDSEFPYNINEQTMHVCDALS